MVERPVTEGGSVTSDVRDDGAVILTCRFDGSVLTIPPEAPAFATQVIEFCDAHSRCE